MNRAPHRHSKISESRVGDRAKEQQADLTAGHHVGVSTVASSFRYTRMQVSDDDCDEHSCEASGSHRVLWDPGGYSGRQALMLMHAARALGRQESAAVGTGPVLHR